MTQRILALVLMVLIVIGLSAAPASAQIVNIKGAPRPGMTIINPLPLPVVQTGITGKVATYDGAPVGGVSITVSLIKYDSETGETYPDPTTTKKFGPCMAGVKTNCVAKEDGTYTILNDALPSSGNSYDPWRELDIRAETSEYYHHLANQIRVGLDGSTLVTVQEIGMNPIGMLVLSPETRWVNERVVSVGLWVRSDWAGDQGETILVDFSFAGSSWTKAQVQYGTTLVAERVREGWNWVERWFWAPENSMGYFGGSFCGEVQVRPTWSAEWVYGETKQACVRLPRPQSDSAR